MVLGSDDEKAIMAEKGIQAGEENDSVQTTNDSWLILTGVKYCKEVIKVQEMLARMEEARLSMLGKNDELIKALDKQR